MLSSIYLTVPSFQCDQIKQFIGLLATFQSLWQQLVCPNLPHSLAIFVKVSKCFIFLVESFLGNFIDIWRLFAGHTASYPPTYLTTVPTFEGKI